MDHHRSQVSSVRSDIIVAATTGSVPRKKDTPAIAVTPAHSIESTHEALEAGTAVVHTHVRNTDESPDFAWHFRVLCYDSRGHGESSVTASPYSVEQLDRDVLGLADTCGNERFDFCSLSIEGMIGMYLGDRAGQGRVSAQWHLDGRRESAQPGAVVDAALQEGRLRQVHLAVAAGSRQSPPSRIPRSSWRS